LGEALALDWQDVDLDGKRALIRRSVAMGRRPRRRAWLRHVDLASKLVERLRTLPNREGRVFEDHVASFSSPRRVRRLFRRLSRRAQLPPASFHMLRHTWAATMLAAGVPLRYVSVSLGHASSDLTMWIYQRAEIERAAEQASAEALARLRHTLG
jgi:integrase